MSDAHRARRELHSPRNSAWCLDAVFHHTRAATSGHFATAARRGALPGYCDWYHLDFTRRGWTAKPFNYKWGWAGHYDLVKLNVRILPFAISF